MAKTVKKVDPKAIAKTSLMDSLKNFLESQDLEVLDGKTYGMTAGTLVIRMADTDIQLKPITPKAGVTRYEVVEE